MPQYKTHSNFNIFIALPITLLFIYKFFDFKNVYILTFTISYIYSTLFMSPDVDLAYQNKLFSLKGLLTLPFRLYALIFRHRGISHKIVIGTITRIMFVLSLISLILILIDKTIYPDKLFFSFWKEYKPYIIFITAGIVLADFFHIVLDLKKTKKY